MTSTITVRGPQSHPRRKPVPSISLVSSYFESADSTDENLLILLHGLGDSNIPFAKLGRQLKLPQTATLSLQAPDSIPFLLEDDPEGFQWYPSFDQLGNILSNPNPTKILDEIITILKHLINECNWPARNIHLFGFGQGGSIAGELGLLWWKQEMNAIEEEESRKESRSGALGSIISVSGPLLSYPTLSKLCPTRFLIVHRTGSGSEDEGTLPPNSLASFKKGYSNLQQVKLKGGGGGGGGMPKTEEEWKPIMTFWSQVLEKRRPDDLYEVMSGGAVPT